MFCMQTQHSTCHATPQIAACAIHAHASKHVPNVAHACCTGFGNGIGNRNGNGTGNKQKNGNGNGDGNEMDTETEMETEVETE